MANKGVSGGRVEKGWGALLLAWSLHTSGCVTVMESLHYHNVLLTVFPFRCPLRDPIP